MSRYVSPAAKENNRVREKARYAANIGQNREKRREHYSNNKEKYIIRARLREIRLERASPKWLTRDHWKEIAGVYADAKAASENTGIPHVVDHIWPLRGRTSCGLHVPWNLMVTTQAYNDRKGNNDPI